jgi:hypothetical protein
MERKAEARHNGLDGGDAGTGWSGCGPVSGYPLRASPATCGARRDACARAATGRGGMVCPEAGAEVVGIPGCLDRPSPPPATRTGAPPSTSLLPAPGSRVPRTWKRMEETTAGRKMPGDPSGVQGICCRGYGSRWRSSGRRDEWCPPQVRRAAGRRHGGDSAWYENAGRRSAGWVQSGAERLAGGPSERPPRLSGGTRSADTKPKPRQRSR